MGRDNLTEKQAEFVRQYLVDLNATQAAVRAGYSAKTANEQGSRLLANVNVSAAILEAQTARAERTGVTADMVVRELAKIGFSDIRKMFGAGGSLRRVEDLDDDAAACLSSVKVVIRKIPGGDADEVEHTAEIKLWDKRAALVDLGKHLGMFTDRVELTGKDGGPLQHQQITEDADAVERGIARLAAAARAASVAGGAVH